MPGFGRSSGGTSVMPGSNAGQELKRIRKAQDNGTLEQTVAATQQNTPSQRIAQIEKASGASLPSRLVLGLAQSNTSSEELHHASRIISRIIDISPKYLLGQTPFSGYVDPVTGAPTISLETARRIIKPDQPKIIASLLAPMIQQGQMVRMGPNGERVEQVVPSATRVAKAFVALAPIEGQSMDFGTAMSASLHLARSKTDLTEFARNLSFAVANAKGLTPGMAVMVAQLAADQGKQFASIDDIGQLVLPQEYAAQIAQARARQANVAAIKGAGGYIAYEQQRAAQMNAAVQEAATGTAAPVPTPAHGLPVATAGVGTTSQMLDYLKGGEQNFIQEGKRLVDGMAGDPNVFANSPLYNVVFKPLGKVLGYASGAVEVTGYLGLNFVKRGPLTEKVSQIPGIGHALAEVTSLSLYDPNQTDGPDYWSHQSQVMKDLFFGRETLPGWLEKDSGVSPWVGIPLDLALQFSLSPDVLALKVLKDAREARLITDAEGFASNAERFVNGPMRPLGILPGSRRPFAENLARIFRDSGDTEQAFIRQVDLVRETWGGRGFDSRTVSAIFDYAQAAKQAGRSEEDLTKGIQYFLARSMGQAGAIDETPLGSLARWVEQEHADAQRVADTYVPQDLANPEGYMPSGDYTALESDRSVGLIDSWDQYIAGHGPIQLEVPHAVGIPRRIMSTLRDSELVGGSQSYRNVAALFNYAPGIRGGRLTLNVEEDPASDIVAILKRSRVFDQQELAQARLEMSRAASEYKVPGATVGRELSIANVQKKWNDMAIERVLTKDRIPQSMEEDLLNTSGGMFHAKSSNPVFGSLPAEGEHAGLGHIDITEPLARSQLPNTFEFVDPVWLRRAASEQMGALRRFRNGMLRGLRLPGGVERLDPQAAIERMISSAREVLNPETADKAVAALTDSVDVPTTAELRGVLTKAIGDTDATRLWDDASLSQRIPVGQFARSTRGGTPLTLTAAYHNTAELLINDLFLRIWKPLVVLRPSYILRVVGQEEQARFIATMGLFSRVESGKTGSRLLSLGDRVLGESKTIDYPIVNAAGDAVDITSLPRRPGMLPPDALAENTAARLIPPGTDATARRMFEKASSISWVSKPNDGSPDFYTGWMHDLVAQGGRDPLISRYLAGFRDGKSDEQIVNETFDWLHSPQGQREANAFMGPRWSDDALHQRVETGVKVFRAYTPNPTIAQAALDQTLTADMLKGVPKNLQPTFVHGPEIEGVMGHKGVFGKMVDAVHYAILQKPTNELSRQPYFKAWYSRMYKSILDQAQASGTALTEDFTRNAAKEARRFALGQVSQVMFDFTRQMRLGEMVNWLIPFFQPFSEEFQVWSRIIARNPAVPVYFTKLWDAGKESGFLKPDPTTGQTTVALDWWAKALSMVTLGHVALPAGWKASAPLDSFNLFFQAALPIPTGGLAGDIPIPMPGFNPEALAVLQRFAHSDLIPEGARKRVASYLFQYGAETPMSLLPTYMRHFITAIPGVHLNSDELNSTADEFLRLYAHLGLNPSTTTPVPDMSRKAFFDRPPEDRIALWKTWLSKQATDQARDVEVWRGFASAFFPASPQVRSPLAPYEQELANLRRTPAQGGLGYQAGTDEFVRRHPELGLLTIGKSIWTGGEAGSTAPGAGSPISIPANPLVDQFLRSAGAKKFAQKYPEWVWAIIPAELRDAQFDTGTYFDQIAQGLRDVQSPMDYLSKAETQKGWDTFFAIQTSWQNWQDTHPQFTESTATYIATKHSLYDAPVYQLRRQNPDWASEFGNFNTQGVDPKVMAHARSLVKMPMFLKTDAGAGLQEYLQMRDELLAKMRVDNVTTIRTQAAQDLGLTDQYNLGVDQIIKAHPDFKTPYQFFFSNDLQGVKTYEERILDNPNTPPEIKTQLATWETQYKAAQTAIDTATDPISRSQAFIDLRTLGDQAAAEFPAKYNPQMLQWKSLTPEAQDARRSDLLSKPYVFLTQFERQTILGEPTDSAAETVWVNYDKALLDIQKYQVANPGQPVGPLYDQINTQLATLAQNNPTLQAQLVHANDWTYLTRSLVPGAKDPSDAAYPYWQTFLDGVHKFEVAAVQGDVHGLSSGSVAQQQWWGQMQSAIQDYRDQLFEQSPIFKNEYLNAEKASPSDTLIENLVPDTFYPVGGSAFVTP